MTILRPPTILLASTLALAAALAPVAQAVPERRPVLLVHGIDDDHRAMAPLQARLKAAGWQHVRAIDLVPGDGRVGIDVLAGQVQHHAGRLLAATGSREVDVVAFSMGALVSRYWLQRLDGKAVTRRFVSISGPHQGTWMAYTRLNDGGRQMRPQSDLVADLAADADPWGRTRVFSFWTPYDLMIVPPESSALPQATAGVFPVLLHPWMLSDDRVLDAVVRVLADRESARPSLPNR